MDKKLPKVFANKIDKKINNNNTYYMSNENSEVLLKDESEISSNNINQKIKSIFSSTRYVYKADVIITTKDESITKKIIGKNKNHLITIDNELIPITDIIDIKFKD